MGKEIIKTMKIKSCGQIYRRENKEKPPFSVISSLMSMKVLETFEMSCS